MLMTKFKILKIERKLGDEFVYKEIAIYDI